MLLADSDPQGTPRQWPAASEEDMDMPSVVGADHDRLDTDLRDVKSAFDLVVIDGAPRMEKRAAAAVRAADLVLMPVQPRAADIRAMAPLVELIQARREVTESKPIALLPGQQADHRDEPG